MYHLVISPLPGHRIRWRRVGQGGSARPQSWIVGAPGGRTAVGRRHRAVRGRSLRLPGVLAEVVEAMREGKVITLVPRTQRLTTEEAADFLGISRPTLVKLLQDGKIPYDKPVRHRRILFTDLLACTERQREHRRAALDRTTEDASEAGLYDATPEDYTAALSTRTATRPP
jgi:excisionase family DNA binding protein